eukprot:scaffold35692_cov15-Tisochrysis_lutea.AAC.1
MVSANPHYMVWNCDDGFAQSSCVAVDLLEASDTEIRSRECRTNANLCHTWCCEVISAPMWLSTYLEAKHLVILLAQHTPWCGP